MLPVSLVENRAKMIRTAPLPFIVFNRSRVSQVTHHGDGWGSSRVVVVGGLLVKSPCTAETEVAIFRVAAFTTHRFA